MGGTIDGLLGTKIFGDSASDKAIGAQMDATRQANATQKYMFDTQREDYKPWRDAGVTALGQLQDPNLLNNYQGDPGYQFRLGEGEKAINASAAARGMGNSGATMKALLKYGQDFASNEYNNAYNRTYGRLSSLAGMGQGATQGMAGAAQNYGNAVSSNQIGMGNAIGAANIAQSNQQSQLFGSLLGAGGMALGGYLGRK